MVMRSKRLWAVVVGITGWALLIATSRLTASAASGDGPVIAAAGNIACDPNNPAFNGLAGSSTACRMLDVSDLLLRSDGSQAYRAVLSLGDNQYVCGGLTAYQRSYDPTWGRAATRTYPVTGDKDYRSSANAPTGTDCSDPPGDASGFFSYFDGLVPSPAPGYLGPASDPMGAGGYYSFDLPRGCTPGVGSPCWHVIALNSNCRKAPGCTPGTTQYSWLSNDLTTHPESSYPCTLVYWHVPRFSSGAHNAALAGGIDPTYLSWWKLLYAKGADVILNAHEHDYERFAPMDPAGNPDAAAGIREWVVGTGGASHARFPSAARLPTSQASNDNTFGILTLQLHTDSYDWRFVPAEGTGSFTDASSSPSSCH
jgi:hypothetical protein